jgi:hypothetical protein
MQTIPIDLLALWRKRAETLRTYGDPNSARLWDIAAQELEQSLEAIAGETLSLREAVRESGFTADHLGRRSKSGRSPTLVGRPLPASVNAICH